jgi:arylsulfatase A-like enzyme
VAVVCSAVAAASGLELGLVFASGQSMDLGYVGGVTLLWLAPLLLGAAVLALRFEAAASLGFVALGVLPEDPRDYLWSLLIAIAFTVVGRARRLAARRPLAFGLALAAALTVAGRPRLDSAAARGLPELPTRGAPADPSVLLIVLDTVRADHMSLYGYARPTTPGLERFVARTSRAVVYPSARSTEAWTVPTHASLFTGELASVHGASALTFPTHDLARWGTVRASATLASTLRDAGYVTIGIAGNPWLTMVQGMDTGFDVFYSPPWNLASRFPGEQLRATYLPLAMLRHINPHPDAARVIGDADRALARCAGRACLVFVNLMDAHAPYAPPPDLVGRFDGRRTPAEVGPARPDSTPADVQIMQARYDEELLDLDRHLSGWLDRLDAAGRLDTAWVVITSDHGEAFLEHGVGGHGTSIYDEEVRIPLLIVPPKGVSLPPATQPVSLIDVTATLTAATGPKRALGRGHDLRAALPATRGVRIEYFGDPAQAPAPGDDAAKRQGSAVVSEHWKLLRLGDHLELYDLAQDPGERHDLARSQQSLVQRLQPGLSGAIAPAPAPPSAAPPTANEATLRALGYVQ